MPLASLPNLVGNAPRVEAQMRDPLGTRFNEPKVLATSATLILFNFLNGSFGS